MNKINEILEKIGITNQESRVYIALLELQEAKTGKLCDYTKIASSNIYKILESLIKKGLVNFRMQNNIKIFMASSPDSLNELFLEKQNKLEEERKEVTKAITELKRREIKEPSQINYKYYEGISGIKAMWHEINDAMNKDSIMKVYTGKKGSYQRLIGFFNIHHKMRKKKKVKERMIFPKEDIKLAKKRTDKLTEIKFMKLNNDAEWGVWNDLYYIHYYPVNKKPYGILVKDPIFSKTMEQVFDQLWSTANK